MTRRGRGESEERKGPTKSPTKKKRPRSRNSPTKPESRQTKQKKSPTKLEATRRDKGRWDSKKHHKAWRGEVGEGQACQKSGPEEGATHTWRGESEKRPGRSDAALGS